MNTTPRNLDDHNPDEWGNIQLPGFDDSKLLDPNLNRVLANKETVKSPTWIANHKAGISTPEYRKKVSDGHKRFWANDTTGHRQLISKSSFDAKISFESKEQAHEIFWKCWAADRGEKLYKQLAKEYNVGYEGIITLVRGGRDSNGPRHHAYCPVDFDALEQMKEDWVKQYQTYKVCAVIPGCDQLDNYDRLYKESGLYARVVGVNRLAIPSLVYYCRFVLKNPSIQSVREYCDSLGIPKTGNDNRQYDHIMKKFPWLRKESSKTFEFDSYNELANFLHNHEDNKTVRKVDRVLAHDYVKYKIQWKGNNFLGWMFYKKTSE